MKSFTVIVCGISIVVVFAIGVFVGQNGLAGSGTKQEFPDWHNEASFKISPALTDAEVDDLAGALCKAAIREHQTRSIAEGAEGVGGLLFMRLSQFPVRVLERNGEEITQATIVMLRSPYDQNVFQAQKFVMKHLESDWASDLARDYVRRFRDIDYSYGRHAHHLRYFLNGALEVGAENVIAVDGTTVLHPESNAYSVFAKYIVDNTESLAKNLPEHNKSELLSFVESRKAMPVVSQQGGGGQPATRPQSK